MAAPFRRPGLAGLHSYPTRRPSGWWGDGGTVSPFEWICGALGRRSDKLLGMPPLVTPLTRRQALPAVPPPGSVDAAVSLLHA